MIRHAVLTTVAVAAISLVVFGPPDQAQDEQPPPRASEDLLARIETLRVKLLADIRASAEAGNALSQYNLGRRYADGDSFPHDAVEAVTWYRLAAAQGHAIAQLNLGLAGRLAARRQGGREPACPRAGRVLYSLMSPLAQRIQWAASLPLVRQVWMRL